MFCDGILMCIYRVFTFSWEKEFNYERVLPNTHSRKELEFYFIIALFLWLITLIDLLKTEKKIHAPMWF